MAESIIPIQLRRDTQANWASVNPVLTDGEIGYEKDTLRFKMGDGVSTWNALPYGGIYGPSPTNMYVSYGDGSDGDLSLSSGLFTLTRDMYYNNLTLSGTSTIRTNGFRLYIKGTLDISNAGFMAIHHRGIEGLAATTQTGATAPTAAVAGTLGAQGAAGAGGTGVAGAGVQAAAVAATSPAIS